MDDIESAILDIKEVLRTKYPYIYKIMNKKRSKAEVRTLLNMIEGLILDG